MHGGSDDSTVKMLEEYDTHDDYHPLWVSEPQDGKSGAINRVFEWAGGIVIA
jgi:glycosyltransferase involved in cell wall biosynthesis